MRERERVYIRKGFCINLDENLERNSLVKDDGDGRRGLPNFEFVVSTKKLEEVSGFACETDKLDFRRRL